MPWVYARHCQTLEQIGTFPASLQTNRLNNRRPKRLPSEMSQTDDVWARTLLKSDKRWADQIDSDDEQTDMSAGHQGDLEDLIVFFLMFCRCGCERSCMILHIFDLWILANFEKNKVSRDSFSAVWNNDVQKTFPFSWQSLRLFCWQFSRWSERRCRREVTSCDNGKYDTRCRYDMIYDLWFMIYDNDLIMIRYDMIWYDMISVFSLFRWLMVARNSWNAKKNRGICPENHVPR